MFCLALVPETLLGQSVPDANRDSIAQLAQDCRSARQLPEAERLLQQKIDLDEQVDGATSRHIAEDLDTLSEVLTEDKKYGEAEKAITNALAIYTLIEGPERATNRFYLERLANLAAQQQRFVEAEQLYEEILALEGSDAGSEHTRTLRDLAEVYRLAKDYPRSEALLMEVAESKSLEPESGERLDVIEHLAVVYEEQGQFEEAEALYRNAVEDSQRTLPHGHLTIISNLNELASFYARRQNFEEADEYYKLAIEQFSGRSPDNALMDGNLAIVMRNYAGVLRKEGRTDDAEQYENRAKTIEDHLQTARPVCGSVN